MIRFWTIWAAQVVLAIRVGEERMVRLLVATALLYTLALLDSLGIQYGPRPAV